jgi:protease-4
MARGLFLAPVLLLAGCYNGIVLKPCRVGGPVQEQVIHKADCLLCRNKVALIDVDGLICNAKIGGGLFGDGENPVAIFRERLDAAANDKKVKAVVLRINSPGGAVTASDIMYQDLLNFRRDTGKPVVACMMDVAASGAYYLAMGCDHVYAHPTTVTGSIGVIMSLYDAHGLMEKIGVVSNPIKSGPNKDLGNPLRTMSDEERAILQGMVNGFYDQFVRVVAWGRNLPEDRVRALADGRIYSGLEAYELGLVDDVGYLEDAIHRAKSLACIHDAKVIVYDRGCGNRCSIYAAGPRIPDQIRVQLEIPGASAPGGAHFLYLWQPGAPR